MLLKNGLNSISSKYHMRTIASEHPIRHHFMFSNSLIVYVDDAPSLNVYDFRDDELLCTIPLGEWHSSLD